MSVDLLPCPWGCDGEIGHRIGKNTLRHVCMVCGAQGPAIEADAENPDAWEQSRAAWNRRAATSPAGDLADGLEAILSENAEAFFRHEQQTLREAAQALQHQSTGVTEITDEMVERAARQIAEHHWPVDYNGTKQEWVEDTWRMNADLARETLAAALSAQERG